MTTLSEAHAAAARISQGSKPSFRFSIKGVSCETSVVNFTVDERISSPFEIDLTLATSVKVDIDKIVDKEAVLTIQYDSNERHFHGIVRQFTCLGSDGEYSIYHAQVVPALWLLSLEQDCRIFQFMKVQDIIKEILGESNIRSNHFRFALKNEERKRKFCVQYRETDLNFISRLLEEEGIFYFFEHYKDKHVVVFADCTAAYLPIPGEQQIRFNTNDGMVPEKESVFGFISSRHVRPSKLTQRDFNYKRTTLDLTTSKNYKTSSHREIYDFPGNYFKQEKGSQIAETRLERLLVFSETAEGQSTCSRITPGYKWELTNHDYKGNYVTVATIHNGSQPQVLGEQAGMGGFSYSNEFLVIPDTITVRPQIVAEKPIIAGLQTWTVVGPPGEEICTDGYGRIKAQPPWDRLGKRDDRSSCWLRVAQSWGGLGRGAQYIPRIGDEVVVAFMEGDPDRPIITGSVYNSDNMPINDLKKSITQSGFKTKTHKGDGFHELRFDDAKGQEEIFLHSQKDWNIVVRNDKGQTIGGNRSTAVTGKSSETAKEITLTAEDSITFRCGENIIVMDASGITIKGTTVHINP